jgi:protein-tyrosine phosphatase
LAEVLLRNLLVKRGVIGVSVASAGVFAEQGSPATAGSRSVLLESEDLSAHLARQIDQEMAAKADLILTMTNAHRNILAEWFPDLEHKLHTIAEYAWGRKEDIPDPYGGDICAYREARREIEAAVGIIFERIVEVDK